MMIGCTIKLDRGNNELPKIPHFDKLLHLGIFTILGLCTTYEIIKKSGKTHSSPILSSVLICTAYGILIEIIQYFLPYRSFEFADMATDCIGGTIGATISKKIFSQVA